MPALLARALSSAGHMRGTGQTWSSSQSDYSCAQRSHFSHGEVSISLFDEPLKLVMERGLLYMRKVVMIVNDTNFAWNLRRELLEHMFSRGYEVILIAQVLEFREEIEKIGCRIIDVHTERRGTNVFSDLQLFCRYLRLLGREKPDIVLTNNIKPNIYAGIACQILRIPYMPNICGLGTPVENPGLMQKLSTFLYKIGVRGCKTIFFQNMDNKLFFEKHGMIPKQAKVIVTPGSGVNLQSHPVLPWPEGNTHFLFAARIMKQKGIDLFLAAARKFASENIIFDVAGQCDDERYRKILEDEQCIRYHGLQRDMIPLYKQCSCFLYPSYYPEGMSNVLLEAAASGRPVIAADRAGCRETLDDGVTGFLVPVNDEKAVIEATEKILRMSSEERKAMGLRGSEKIRREFDRKLVVEAYWEEIEAIQGSK